MKPRECCHGNCQQGRTCPVRIERRQQERRTWRSLIAVMFASVPTGRRRGERRKTEKEA